jgi:hypothetical protein
MDTDEPAGVTRIVINDKSFELSPEVDIDELKKAIETAVKTSGTFVEFSVADGSIVNALVGSPCNVFISQSSGGAAENAIRLYAVDLPGEFDF